MVLSVRGNDDEVGGNIDDRVCGNGNERVRGNDDDGVRGNDGRVCGNERVI